MSATISRTDSTTTTNNPEFSVAQVCATALAGGFLPAGLLVADNFRRRGEPLAAAAAVLWFVGFTPVLMWLGYKTQNTAVGLSAAVIPILLAQITKRKAPRASALLPLALIVGFNALVFAVVMFAAAHHL